MSATDEATPHGKNRLVTEREQRLIDAILDIDAHADALGEDDDGFVTGGYIISIGSLHRALGIIGHTAPKCRDCDGHDQHELRDANYGMWNAMQRAANHPEAWRDYITPALDRYRTIVGEAHRIGKLGWPASKSPYAAGDLSPEARAWRRGWTLGNAAHRKATEEEVDDGSERTVRRQGRDASRQYGR